MGANLFHGAGSSQGQYGERRDETADLIVALDWLCEQVQVDAGRLAVAGYSFGAWIEARACVQDERARAFAAVALPMEGAYHEQRVADLVTLFFNTSV